MSLVNNPFVLIATVSLTIQIVVLFLLIYGYTLKRRMIFRRHGFVMATALILHLAFVFGIMIPSFVLAIIPEYVVTRLYSMTSIVSLIHVPLGVLAFFVWCLAGCRLALWRHRGLFCKKKGYALDNNSLAFGIVDRNSIIHYSELGFSDELKVDYFRRLARPVIFSNPIEGYLVYCNLFWTAKPHSKSC